MKALCPLALLVAVLTAAGCQPHPLDDRAWPEARPLGQQIESYRPPMQPTSSGGAQDAPAPTGELTLAQAMALALTHNPRLQAFGWEVRRAEARMLQASAWPNPEVEVEFENFGGSGDFKGTRSLETTISLAQTFPLGGDIARRRALAGYEAQLAGWDYEAARLEVLVEVTRRYVSVLAARQQALAAEEALRLAEQVQAITRNRIEAGAAAPIEAARAGVPVAAARVALKRAEREYDAARTRLALMWGSSTPTFDSVRGSLDQLQPPPTPQQLVALINQNPDVARWAAEISARQAEARLAEAEATPDVTGWVGYRRIGESDDNALVAGVSLPLPIFDRRKSDVLAARLGATSAERRRREAELQLEAALSEAYARLAGAYDEATALRDHALPLAVEAFDLIRTAFENGDVAFIDVIDAERTLFELRSQHLNALAGYHAAAAEIEGLIGQPLSSLTASDANPLHDDLTP